MAHLWVSVLALPELCHLNQSPALGKLLRMRFAGSLWAVPQAATLLRQAFAR